MYPKVLKYTILRNERKIEIESSGHSEGIENILIRVVKESFNVKIFVHRPEENKIYFRLHHFYLDVDDCGLKCMVMLHILWKDTGH